MSTDDVIKKYKTLHVKLYDDIPNVRKNGAWIYVGDLGIAYRKKDLIRTIEIYEARLEERENIQTEYISKRKWQKDIPNHLITMFLDELYSRCKSSHSMELFMKDFACGEEVLDLRYNEDEDDLCNAEECSIVAEVYDEIEKLDFKYQNLKESYEELKDKNDSILEDLNDAKGTIIEQKNEYNKWKGKYKRLKENSILFSMEDLDKEGFKVVEYPDIDDEIPF